MLPVIFRPLADADAVDAKAWYAAQSPETAGRFVDALAELVSLISEHPYAFRSVEGDIRRAVLRRFPYAVYYRVTKEEVVVLAVHGRQDPAHWKTRTE